MRLSFDAKAWDEYLYWQTQDKKVFRKLNQLIRDCQRHPFEGIGKPEPLKGDYAGYWSRRITQEHRLVYKAAHDQIIVVKCRYRY